MGKDHDKGKLFKNLRPGEYFRELSIVVLGVAVTFLGSGLINAYSVNRDIKENMKMIKIEMEKNVVKVNNIIEYMDNDIKIGTDVLARDYRDIPADTLEMYSYAVSRIQMYSYTEDALEILKISSLMPHIKDKQLLLGIIRSYEAFGNIQDAVGFYNQKKQWALGQGDINDYIVLRDGTVYDQWDLYMKNDAMCNFFSNCSSILSKDDFDNVLGEIGKITARISEAYDIDE